MDKTSKTIGILSGIIIISLFVYLGIQNRKINRLNDENQLQAVELSTLKNEVDTFRTKNGDLVSKVKSIEVDKNNLKQSLETAGLDIKKLKEDNIKWRNISNALQIELQAIGHVETPVVNTLRIENFDTIYFAKAKDWSNNYLSLFNTKIENQKLFTDYEYNVKIGLFQEHVKKGTIVTVKITDPKAKITSANSIIVKHEKKWFEKPWVWGIAGLGAGILISR